MIKTYYPIASSDPNEYVTVDNVSEQLTTNFTQQELYNPKIGEAHPMALDVIHCLQAIREYFNTPIKVNSTYRNYVPTGGANPSTHMLAQAIDFSFISPNADQLYIQIRDDFDNKGELFQLLFSLGCRGFGSYDTFIHIDSTRAEDYDAFSAKRWRTYQGKKYGRWNKMKTLRNIKAGESISSSNPLTTLSGVFSGVVAEINDGEDRGEDKDYRLFFIIGGAILLLAISTWLTAKLFKR